jgi:hypothetical protein
MDGKKEEPPLSEDLADIKLDPITIPKIYVREYEPHFLATLYEDTVKALMENDRLTRFNRIQLTMTDKNITSTCNLFNTFNKHYLYCELADERLRRLENRLKAGNLTQLLQHMKYDWEEVKLNRQVTFLNCVPIIKGKLIRQMDDLLAKSREAQAEESAFDEWICARAKVRDVMTHIDELIKSTAPDFLLISEIK